MLSETLSGILIVTAHGTLLPLLLHDLQPELILFVRILELTALRPWPYLQGTVDAVGKGNIEVVCRVFIVLWRHIARRLPHVAQRSL